MASSLEAGGTAAIRDEGKAAGEGGGFPRYAVPVGAYMRNALAGRSPRMAKETVIPVLRVFLMAGPAGRLGAPVRGDMRVFPAPPGGRPGDIGGIVALGAGHRAGLHGRFPPRVAFGTGKARVGVAERPFGSRPNGGREEQGQACRQWQRVSHNRSSGCAGEGFARGFPRSTLFPARPQACSHEPASAKRAAPSRRTARFADRLNPGTARRSP